jgi:hypothetical protein
VLLLLSAARGVLYAYYVWVAFGYYLVRFGALKGPLSWLAIALQAPIDFLGLLVPFFRTPFVSISPLFSRGPLAMRGRGLLMPDFSVTDLIGEVPAHLVAGAVAYAIVYSAPTFLKQVRPRRIASVVILVLGFDLAIFGVARAPRWVGTAMGRYESSKGRLVLYSDGDPVAYPPYPGQALYSEVVRIETGVEHRYYIISGSRWSALARWKQSYYVYFGVVMNEAIKTKVGDLKFRSASDKASRLVQQWRQWRPSSSAWRRTP